MKITKVDLLMTVLFGISAFAIIVGAFLKLEHWAYGDVIFKGGFVAGFLFSGIEIWRLNKIITKLKEKDLS